MFIIIKFLICVCAVWYLAYSALTHISVDCLTLNPAWVVSSSLVDAISGCPVDTFSGHYPVDTVSLVSRGHCQWVGGGDTVRLVACKPVSENHTSAPPPITPPCLTCTLLISVWVGDMHFDCGRGLVKLNESIGQD